MRLKESLALDSLIKDRLQVLSDTVKTGKELEQRVLALGILVEARNKLDALTHSKLPAVDLSGLRLQAVPR